jgi:hypothetical protein
MSKQKLINLLSEGDNDPLHHELENLLTDPELKEYNKIRRHLFIQRIEGLKIDVLRFLLSNIILTQSNIEDNKYLIEHGLIDNEDDENTLVNMMLDKFTESELEEKVKIYEQRKLHDCQCQSDDQSDDKM